MTSKNQIWKRANAANEVRCISLLEKLFPSLLYEPTIESGVIVSLEKVDTKKKALDKIRLGLQGMTETEAETALLKLDSKKKTSGIKF